jgi:hypothetical protein
MTTELDIKQFDLWELSNGEIRLIISRDHTGDYPIRTVSHWSNEGVARYSYYNLHGLSMTRKDPFLVKRYESPEGAWQLIRITDPNKEES